MCMVDYADVPWTVLTDERRRARKQYQCCECGRTITPGEHYHYTFALSDYEPFTARLCEHCHAASQWLVKVCSGFLFHAIGDDLREHFDNGYESMWLGRVLVGMGRRWKRLTSDDLLPVPTPPPEACMQVRWERA